MHLRELALGHVKVRGRACTKSQQHPLNLSAKQFPFILPVRVLVSKNKQAKMLPQSRFAPGTILWLPHERRLPYNTLDLSDTVPDDYFGRPVLFLATNPSDDAAWILIVR